MRKNISQHMRRSLVIYDFAPDPSKFLFIYEETFILFFISVPLFDGKYGLIGWLVSQEAEEAVHERFPHHQPGEDQHIRTLKVTIKEI